MQLGSAPVSATDPTLAVAMTWTRRLVVPMLVVTVAVLFLVVVLLGWKLQVATSQLAIAEMTAPTQRPGGDQNKQVTPTPASGPQLPTPNTPDTTPPTASNDVGTYLNFLRDIDRRRLILLASNSNATTGQPDAAWVQLDQDFHAVAPPTACGTLASTYDALVTDCETYTEHSTTNPYAPGTANAAVTSVSPSQLTADAARADTELSKVCQMYSITKPLTITSLPS
jgi:hypothetical protein